jgi:hypothetical protein
LAAVKNPNATDNVWTRCVEDEDQDVRKAALENLKNLFLFLKKR